MARQRSTTRDGKAFDYRTIQLVWEKGRENEKYDSGVWRYDGCGSWMRRQEYGNVSSRHGWEIDHVRPVVQAGADDLGNLQPLQWENNRAKGDTHPWDRR